MASIDIGTVRDMFPEKTDAEAAAAYAVKRGYHVILRYKSGSGDYNNLGCCKTDEEVQAYMGSPYCHDTEIIYDGRAKALRITREMVLGAKCARCSKGATAESLVLYRGNDFYVCPRCGLMFCDQCIRYLPLTGSPGYAKCPTCDVQLKRAMAGTIA